MFGSATDDDLQRTGELQASPEADYERFCDGVHALCGIDLAQYMRPQMESRLRAFYRWRGVQCLDRGLERLRSDERERDALLDHITINVSALWRDPDRFQTLATDVLPDLATGGRLRAWSAGCSYGAEAFTLAALCAERIPRAQARILGSDLDRRMVARARAAVFSDDEARDAPPEIMGRRFVRVPGGWRARPELRAMTRFEVSDLLEMRPPVEHYDLILCRNTAFYFTELSARRLHRRLAGALRPGGVLMLGDAERVNDPSPLGLSLTLPHLYRKD